MNVESPTLTTVYLVGSLGKAVGREIWHLDVTSTAEAIRAININTKGKLEEYLRGPAKNRFYKIALQKKTNVIDPNEVTNKSGRSAIYIIPTIKGRKSGFAKIIIGAVLIALTYGAATGYLGTFLAGAATTTSAAGAVSYGLGAKIVLGFGISLMIGGITQLLTPSPKGNTVADPNNSNIFQGNSSSVVQGGCVPLVYGRALVVPIPVAITVDNDDLSTTDTGSQGDVNETEIPGGGIQYNIDP